jgi:hypothetical protein
MDLLIDKRYKEERIIAYNTVEKIKDAAATLESNDPTHKNGVKFFISKKQYYEIIENEFNKRASRHIKKELVERLINLKLKKL